MRSKFQRWPLAILLPSIVNIGVRSQIIFDVVSAISSTSASTATHTVNVGKADHKFEPDIIHADVGDLIVFQFYPTNHSVVKAAYRHPCVPYEMMFTAETGFYSQFQPVGAVLADPPTWELRVNSSEPIFFYCSAPESCNGRQMVGAINPNATQTLADQKAIAATRPFILSPGEPWPDEAEPLTAMPATNTARPEATTSSRTGSLGEHESPTAAANSSHTHHFPPGAIAGVVVGATVIIVLAAALAFFVGRLKSRKALDATEHDDDAQGNPMPVATSPVQAVHGHGGIMYVPVQYVDYARMSMPPNYPQGAPIVPGSPGSPHYSAVSTHDVSAGHQRIGSLSPAVELYVPKSDER